eukprot:GHVU01080514.1.p1 GENE.GHVU01080514.1~~GHVU01080514.1.p1  ORF type:complete len:639 (+),score=68.71 GHVU01080514.1:194-1918(+)
MNNAAVAPGSAANAAGNHTRHVLPGVPLVAASNSSTSFADIGGMVEAKNELQEIVDFFKNRTRFSVVGARLPKGVLLVGPPGSGKTLLARAVAKEAGVPFLSTSGSEFIELYVGQGARRVRELFAMAKKHTPCIIFIDELDAVGGARAAGGGGSGQREHDQTLNQLLVEMDGFATNQEIVVLAATNRIDVLDKALVRPGRFDRVVHVPLPDAKGREKILSLLFNRVAYNATELNIEEIARTTCGLSGADLENLVNEAAILAARHDKVKIDRESLEEARQKISMGIRHGKVMPEHQRTLTAYHEAGHAIVAFYMQPLTDPITVVTITPRGSALGYVEQAPEIDRYGHTKAELEARLAVALGGRVAEEIKFGSASVTTGAQSDLKAATNLAYTMVSSWGMSDSLGLIQVESLLMRGGRGEALADQVSKAVKVLLVNAEKKARKILRRRSFEFDKIAKLLLERETLRTDDIRVALGGKPADTKGKEATKEKVLDPVSTMNRNRTVEGGLTRRARRWFSVGRQSLTDVLAAGHDGEADIAHRRLERKRGLGSERRGGIWNRDCGRLRKRNLRQDLLMS